MSFDEIFGDVPIMAILRGYDPAESVRLATRAWDVGITAVEVPIQTPDAIAAFRAVVAAGHERGKTVGSGTVTTPEQVEETQRAGGGFTVAPGYSPAVVAASARLGLPHLPGVATATDVEQALGAGLTWMKAFPASVLGTGWFTAMISGPFPQLKLVATGGMSAANAAEYLAAGARVISLGSALADPASLETVAELIAGRSIDRKEPAHR